MVAADVFPLIPTSDCGRAAGTSTPPPPPGGAALGALAMVLPPALARPPPAWIEVLLYGGEPAKETGLTLLMEPPCCPCPCPCPCPCLPPPMVLDRNRTEPPLELSLLPPPPPPPLKCPVAVTLPLPAALRAGETPSISPAETNDILEGCVKRPHCCAHSKYFCPRTFEAMTSFNIARVSIDRR